MFERAAHIFNALSRRYGLEVKRQNREPLSR